jgi:hypothetical protein
VLCQISEALRKSLLAHVLKSSASMLKPQIESYRVTAVRGRTAIFPKESVEKRPFKQVFCARTLPWDSTTNKRGAIVFWSESYREPGSFYCTLWPR